MKIERHVDGAVVPFLSIAIFSLQICTDVRLCASGCVSACVSVCVTVSELGYEHKAALLLASKLYNSCAPNI